MRHSGVCTRAHGVTIHIHAVDTLATHDARTVVAVV
jgi:hypothetical protein